MVAAYYFGINGKINAFTVAFQIPNLVRALLADAALSGAFVPVFSDLHREGRPQARLAGRVDDLLARPPRARWPHGAVHPHRAAPDPALRRPGRRLRPRRRALARPLPDRRPARAQRRHRRDPQHVRPLHRARADARCSGTSRSSSGSGWACPGSAARTPQLYVYAGAILVGTADPAVPARALAARARRSPAARARLARPGGAPVLRADAARDADARADQRQRRDRHPDRLAARRSGPRARGDQLRRSGSTCCRRGCSRSPSRRCCSRPSPGSRRGTTSTDSAPRSAPGLRQIGFLLIPASVVSAVLAEPIVRARLRARRVHRVRRDGRRRLPGGVLARPRLQRLDADADAWLLRAAVELAADADRGRHARA